MFNLNKLYRLDATQILELQHQLAEKDELLTETRLEALSSAAQLQALRETVSRLRSELQGIKRGMLQSCQYFTLKSIIVIIVHNVLMVTCDILSSR